MRPSVAERRKGSTQGRGTLPATMRKARHEERQMAETRGAIYDDESDTVRAI